MGGRIAGRYVLCFRCPRRVGARVVLLLGLLVRRFEECHSVYARSEPGEPPEYCTLFNHMVKSGGSSIKDKLHNAARIDNVLSPGVCVNGQGNEKKCLDAMNHSPVITGYAELLRYPLESIGRQCEYFTVMRHPIDRLVSAFFYCPTDHDVQSRPDKWCGGRSDPDPLPQRLVEFAQQGWKNKASDVRPLLPPDGLLRTIQGVVMSTPPHPPTPFMPPQRVYWYCQPGAQQAVVEAGGWDLLEEVEAILDTYTAVGILEHWDLSMQLFDARVKSPVSYWQRIGISNPGKLSGLRDDMFRWAHTSPETHRAMATDMLLYDYAVSVFKLQTAATLGTVWA